MPLTTTQDNNVYFETPLELIHTGTIEIEGISVNGGNSTGTINEIKLGNYINDEQYIYDYMLWSLSFISLFVLIYGLLSIFKIKKNV